MKGNDSVVQLLKGEFYNWFTISSLSIKLFNTFFLEYNISSSDNDDVYTVMQHSYQGGYTQAFAIGEVNEQVFYLDYNSMYPSIMSKLQVPLSFKKCKLIAIDK